MTLEAPFKEIIPLIGVESNISFLKRKENRLYIRLKDQRLLELSALRMLDGVKDCTVKSGQLCITLFSEKEEKQMANNKQIAEQVLAAVGGKENVANVTHCMTRLRFNLKNDGNADK